MAGTCRACSVRQVDGAKAKGAIAEWLQKNLREARVGWLGIVVMPLPDQPVERMGQDVQRYGVYANDTDLSSLVGFLQGLFAENQRVVVTPTSVADDYHHSQVIVKVFAHAVVR